MNAELKHAQFELKEYKVKNKTLKEKIYSMSRKILRYESKSGDILAKRLASVLDAVVGGLSGIVGRYFPRLGNKKLDKAISEACWSFKDGIAQRGIMSKARTYLRETVFTPQAVLSALYFTGGVCSLQAYQVIYNINYL